MSKVRIAFVGTGAMGQQAIPFIKVIKGEIRPPCDVAEAVEDLKAARDYICMYKAL